MSSKYFTQEEIEQAKKLGLTYPALFYRLWKWGDKQRALTQPMGERGSNKDWENDIYAMYKGEEFITTGTVYEIAEDLGIKADVVKNYTYPSWQKRNKGNAQMLVYIGRDDEEEVVC